MFLPAVVPTIVNTRRGPVEYAAYGEGPTVLALHGAMGGYDQSLILANTIGESGYRFVALSRPGYLGTPLSLGRTAEEQADVLADVLDALRIRRAGMMVVSGGGPAAIQFALRHRDRCWGLVLASTCGGRVRERIPFGFKVMKFLARWPWFEARIRRKAERDPEGAARRSVADPAVRARLLADPEAGQLFRALCTSTLDRMALRLDGTENDILVSRTTDYPLEQIAVPTLVIHGTADRLVPFDQHGNVLASRIPGAELLAIDGGEHVSIFTHRNEVKARVSRFLRQHAPAIAG
jgi:pimeloyl-ACP methyl ester carboxylesterase